MRTYLRLGLLTLVLALGVLAGRGVPAYAWTAPAALNSNAASDSGGDSVPQLTTDGGGNWVAVWQSFDSLGGTIGDDWDILVARSADNGGTWTPPAPLNTNAATDSGDDGFPQVTTDGGGNWVAVWESGDDLGDTIGWDYDILVARSTDNGATWTAPAALNANAATDSGGDYYPQLTTDGGGHWVAVWDSNENLGGTIGWDSDILVARSDNNGASWTASAALNTNAATDSGDDYRPQLTTDGAGNWVAAWESQDSLGGTIGTEYDILVARSTDNGATWTAPAPLNTNAASDSGHDYASQVTTDGGGNWVAVWTSDDSLGGTIGTDADILVARSANNGAAWTAPAALNSNAATDSGYDGDPQVTTDGGGNWVAVWDSNENLGGTIGTDLDILVARSDNNGATWAAPAALNTNAASDSGYDGDPQVTTDGGGNWVAVWDSNENMGGTIGDDWDILYATEGPGTPPNRPPVCSAAAPSVAEIWPPNHKMVGVKILGVTDPDGDPISIVITGITQDEPVNGLGDGDTSPDGAGVGTNTAQVRAERAGTPKVPGNGRMYHIHFEASDGKSGACSGVAGVGVPHDQRPGHVIVDGGELYDSIVP